MKNLIVILTVLTIITMQIGYAECDTTKPTDTIKQDLADAEAYSASALRTAKSAKELMDSADKFKVQGSPIRATLYAREARTLCHNATSYALLSIDKVTKVIVIDGMVQGKLDQSILFKINVLADVLEKVSKISENVKIRANKLLNKKES